MATKGKDVGCAGKEKRGTSPSRPLQSGNNPTRRSPKASKAESTDKDHSSASQRPIPSYLKPTISSMNIKKDESNHNSTSAHRRRSFDKPPSPSRIQKELISPAGKEKPVKTSSLTTLSPRPTTTAPKPVTDRTLKTPRVVKSQTSAVKSSSTKRTSGHVPTKKEASTASSASATKAPPVADTSHKLSNEPKREDNGSSGHVVQEKEVENIDEVVGIPLDLPPIDVPDSIEPKTDGGDEKLKPTETSTTPENQDASTAVRTDESIVAKIYDREIKDESNSSHPEENSAGEPKVETQDMEGEEHASESPIAEERQEDADKSPITTEGKEDAAENAMTKEGEVDAAETPITKVRDEDATENPITKEGEDGGNENPITQIEKENVTEDPITKEGNEEANEDSIAKEGVENATDVPIARDEEEDAVADATTEERGDEATENPITEEGKDDATENPTTKAGEEKATKTNIAQEGEMVSTADPGDAQNTKNIEEQQVDEGSQKHADGKKQQHVDGERQKDVVEEEKREAKTVTPKTPKQPDSGKKDSQDYNKVIEETASKLREKKNKVRALAGAFETVISLQEPEP